MPEVLEVEASRVLLERRALGRRITAVNAPDAWYLKGGLTPEALTDLLRGRRFATVRRRGKLLLLDVERGPTIGIRFGMTGRVFVDGHAALEKMAYGSDRDEPAWDRVVIELDGLRSTGRGGGTARSRGGASVTSAGRLVLRDPRRLGAVEIEPDETRLGPDVLTLGRADLDRVVTRSRAPLKAVLMDQSRVAGLGNLLTDELLWRAGLDPARPARSLDGPERVALFRSLRATLRTLARRGGSHTGDHMPGRNADGVCPRDGAPMLRRTVGGRTTYSCPEHQH